MDSVLRAFLCAVLIGLLLYIYVEKQNQVTKLRLLVPQLMQEHTQLEQENIRLQFLVDQYESPEHLLELARLPEYSHLKRACEERAR